MWNEYGLTYSTAELLRDETLNNAADMKRQIAERKNAIRGLGNVNVNAIEDYKEISERYEFMKTQHDDLITAQDALYKIIEELDIGMRKQFTEKFAMIRAELTRYSGNSSEADTEVWSSSRMKISWSQESRSFPSRRERSSRT